ncbi:MAG: uroporphyrinogen decarboxylase family protein [Phycisphaerales bacterium]
MKLLQHGSEQKTPFWEVWFYMFDFCNRRYGSYEKIENRIAMAIDLGMNAVPLCYIDTNSLFAKSSNDSSGVTHYAGGLLNSLDQLAGNKNPDLKCQVNKLKEDKRKVADAGLAGWMTLMHCFHAGNISMGLENLSLKIYDEPEFVHEYLEWVELRNRRAIEELVAEVMPDFALFDGDCAFKSGLMVRPELYRTFVFEKTKQTVSLLKKLGIPYTFHSDGKAGNLLPILIELGFSAFHGCEKAANDLCELVENFGQDICLVGNMDVSFLANSSPELIRIETEKMLTEGTVKGTFIAACNTSPQDNIPDENYLTFCDVIKKF